MKKVVVGITAMVLMLSLSSMTVFAHCHSRGRHHSYAGNYNSSYGYHNGGCQYVDADGNGICDYHDAHCWFVDADGDGICDDHGVDCPFVDADGDGICDNYAAGVGCYYNGVGHHGGCVAR